jgi:hypothetical protein
MYNVHVTKKTIFRRIGWDADMKCIHLAHTLDKVSNCVNSLSNAYE